MKAMAQGFPYEFSKAKKVVASVVAAALVISFGNFALGGGKAIADDGTVEGLEHIGRPVFTVQYHPEVCPGPMDTSYLFDKFIENIEKSKGGAQ